MQLQLHCAGNSSRLFWQTSRAGLFNPRCRTAPSNVGLRPAPSGSAAKVCCRVAHVTLGKIQMLETAVGPGKCCWCCSDPYESRTTAPRQQATVCWQCRALSCECCALCGMAPAACSACRLSLHALLGFNSGSRCYTRAAAAAGRAQAVASCVAAATAACLHPDANEKAPRKGGTTRHPTFANHQITTRLTRLPRPPNPQQHTHVSTQQPVEITPHTEQPLHLTPGPARPHDPSACTPNNPSQHASKPTLMPLNSTQTQDSTKGSSA